MLVEISSIQEKDEFSAFSGMGINSLFECETVPKPSDIILDASPKSSFVYKTSQYVLLTSMNN